MIFLMKVSETKIKYINLGFKKVCFKMYDYSCDIKLKVGNETFKAHREVLEASSDYFAAMFSHNMQEKTTGILELKEISQVGFTAMIEYFYHGYITLDTSNIEGVIESSRFFHIEWLIYVCKHYLIHYLSIEDYSATLHFSEFYYMNVEEIQSCIFSYLSDNFLLLSSKPKFLKLTFELLSELLNGDHFIQASEYIVFRFVMKWIVHDMANREQYRLQFLKSIRYCLFELHELLEIETIVGEVAEIAELIFEAKEYLHFPSRQCLIDCSQSEGRGSKDFLVLYSGIEDQNYVNYKHENGFGFLTECLDSGFLQIIFEFASAANLGNFIFFAGGYERDTWCSSRMFYQYNPNIQRWVELSQMHHARVSFSLSSSDKGLYAVAGIDHTVINNMDREVIHNSVEFYNPEDNLWHFLPPLPFGCYNLAACAIEDNLYVSGGISDDPKFDVPVNMVHVLNQASGCWIELETMNVARHCHAMINKNNKLFVFGGFMKGEDSMNFKDCLQNEMYDPATNQWTLLRNTSAQFGHIYPYCSIFVDKIYLVGGPSKDELYLISFDEDKEEFDQGEPCSSFVHKMLLMRAPMPNHFIQELSAPM